MASGDTITTERPGRFTLRELFTLTCLVSIAGACYSWLDAAAEAAGTLLALTILAIIAFAIRTLTRWSIIEVIGSTMLLGMFLSCIIPVFSPSRGPTRRSSCSNNMRSIVLALLQYESAYGSFPPAYIADAQGNPMHSWRVLLLPFLDQRNLYKQYRFDEPWDGPNNSKLHNMKVSWLSCPSDASSVTNTSYVVVVGSKTMWPGTKTTKLSDIVNADGAGNTIMLVEVSDSGIHWMEPRDLDASQMSMLINSTTAQGISSGHPGGANVGFADGHVRFLSNEVSPTTIRALLTRDGGEPIKLP